MRRSEPLDRRFRPNLGAEGHHAMNTYEITVQAPNGVWHWNEDMAVWVPDDDDCSIRPSKDGSALILMEAGGEYSGEVMVDENGKAPFVFPEATFR